MIHKQTLFLLILSTLFLMPWLLRSEVREIKSMKEIIHDVDRQTLLVFDLDNTLMEPVQSLASDQWYYFIIRQYKEVDHMSDEDAYKKADVVWNKSQGIIESKAVEAITPNLIQLFQKRGIKMMGLTARTYDLADITTKQLKHIGIEFKKPIYPSPMEFKIVDTAHYVNGIIFQGEQNNKGQVLVEFLKRIQLHPKKIVFVDDKQKHVLNMEKALTEAKIPYLGFRYGAADERVERFNKDMEDHDLFCNGNWTTSAEEKRNASIEGHQK